MTEQALEAARAAHRAELAELHEQLARTRHAANCAPARGMLIMGAANQPAEARLARLLMRLTSKPGERPAAWPYGASPE
ncbi:MAG TPA: hypothetical protein VLK36_14095 [Gaiellaceae bacterium]|nr:hypothetical protein [Gaiellaceae bacterium]